MFDVHKVFPSWLLKVLLAGLMLFLVGKTVTMPMRAAPTDTPEEVITGFSPAGFVYTGVELIVASGGYSLESCGFNPALETAVLRRMNADGGDVEVMMERCAFVNQGMVADEDHVYFRDGDNILKRMEIGGGPLNFLGGDTCCGGLAIDETHVYFAKWGGAGADNEIQRYDKAANTTALVGIVPDPNNYHIYGLAVDETHVYWAGGNLNGGVIQRMPKAGGLVETLADSGDGIENARAVALDATHLYWTELTEGRVRRVAKAGGAVTTYADNQGNYMAESIAVNDTHIFWSDTTGGYAGRIRRVAKDSTAVDDIALGQLGPSNVTLIGDYVYWQRHGGIRRLALDTDVVTIDLAVENIEITQAVQSFDNDVPMVADKRAIVRVYPRIVETQGELSGLLATAGLRVFRNGIELTTTPIRPMHETVVVRTTAPRRELLDDTFNFIVPSQWRTDGTYEFRAEIAPASATVIETSLANNSQSVAVTFHQKLPLCVEMVRVRTAPNTYSAFDPGWNGILDWVEASYPIPHIIIDIGGTIEEVVGGPAYEMPGDDSKVMARLGWYDFWNSHGQAGQCGGQSHVFGMIHPDNNVGGLGRRPGWQAWGSMGIESATDTIAPWYSPRGGATMSHELGHNRGRKHVNCGGPEGVDGAYPYDPCNMGPTDDQTQWYGYDIFDDAVVTPAETGDLMSYTHVLDQPKPRWVSDYTYQALYNDLPNASLIAASAAQDHASQLAQDVINADEVIALSAYINPALTAATFDSGYRIENGLVSPEKLAKMTEMVLPAIDGTFHLEQIGARGDVLADFRFELTDLDDEINGDIPLMIVVPLMPDVALFMLRHGDTQLARRAVSRSMPEVAVLTPNGGEVLGDTFKIAWKAADADGDDLRYTIQYSPNGGKNWAVVATDWLTPSIEVDANFNLPGSYEQGLVRVIATDGVNSATDVSDAPFSVATHAPRAAISRPHDGEVFGFGEQISLVGRGFDIEDGMLGDNGLAWQVDGKMVGSGREMVLDGLAIGQHAVALWALDSQQTSNKQEITIHVRRSYCTPEHDRMQVVFVVDSSGQMSGQHGAICDAIGDAKIGFAEMGLDAEIAIFGTTAPLQCAAESIPMLDPTTAVNHPADWGAAIVTVAEHYGWEKDAVRLVVPISNQAPEDGYPIEDPGADRVVVDGAIAAANAAGVAVSPVLIPQTFSPFQILDGLADELATATGGHLIRWQEGTSLDLAGELQEDQARRSCEPEVAGVTPTTATGREAEIALTGQHLWPGTAVYLNEQRMTALTASLDGTVLRFPIPIALEDGEYTLRVEGAATGSIKMPDAVTLESVPDPLGGTNPTSIFLPLVQR